MRWIALIGVLATVTAAGPAWSQSAAPPASKFLQPGDLDAARVLPPPPADPVRELDLLKRIAAARTPERVAQAKHDDGAEDVTSIADVLGPAFDLTRFPATAKLFADLRKEDSAAAKAAKAYFARPRPFEAGENLDICDDASDHNNSYPSGHATMGYTAAAVLADLIPGNAQIILARASDYAESRLVCGVHYPSDLEAGHVLATALVDRLMAKPAFREELEAARAELTAVHLAP